MRKATVCEAEEREETEPEATRREAREPGTNSASKISAPTGGYSVDGYRASYRFRIRDFRYQRKTTPYKFD